jgi:hypothetical protein
LALQASSLTSSSDIILTIICKQEIAPSASLGDSSFTQISKLRRDFPSPYQRSDTMIKCAEHEESNVHAENGRA